MGDDGAVFKPKVDVAFYGLTVGNVSGYLVCYLYLLEGVGAGFFFEDAVLALYGEVFFAYPDGLFSI